MPAGLLWVNSRITSPTFTKDTFNEWYDDEHIPDVIATKSIHAAARYYTVDPSSSHPYLALYPVPDISFLGSERYFALPSTSEKYIPGGKKCFDVAEFDTRWYEFVEEFEVRDAKPGPANLVISAALEPAKGTDDDFHAWYRDEHYRTLSECTGYVRTRRYKLGNALNAKNLETPRNPPKYLALHEFSGKSLPQDDLNKTAETDWSKKITGSLAGAEVWVGSLMKGFGEWKYTQAKI